MWIPSLFCTEDDGCTNEYLKGAYLKTRIAVTAGVKTYVHFTNEGRLRYRCGKHVSGYDPPRKIPFYVQLDGKELPHFLHRRKFEGSRERLVLQPAPEERAGQVPQPKKDHEIMVSFEQFDLIGM